MANQSSTAYPRFDSDARRSVKLFPQPVRGTLPCRSESRWPGLLFILVLGVGLHGSSCAAQSTSASQEPSTLSSRPNSPLHPEEPPDPMVHRAEQRMVERRNSERQKNLTTDTDKLLELAQQLKVEVDKSSKDQLSVDVVKRAEQIEKLAKSVKEKMRGY